MLSAANHSPSALMTRRTTPTRASQTSPSAARPAVRRSALSAAVVVVMTEAPGKCTRLFAPSAARTPPCPSGPGATARSTVTTASDDSARRASLADTRTPCEERGGEQCASLPLIFNVTESAQRVISQTNFENAEVSRDSSPQEGGSCVNDVSCRRRRTDSVSMRR